MVEKYDRKLEEIKLSDTTPETFYSIENAWKTTNRDLQVNVLITLTDICNYSCSYCNANTRFTDLQKKGKSTEFHPGLFRMWLKKLSQASKDYEKQHGTKLNLDINLLGGEFFALSEDKYKEYYKIAQDETPYERGSITILTNGHFTDKIIELIKTEKEKRKDEFVFTTIYITWHQQQIPFDKFQKKMFKLMDKFQNDPDVDFTIQTLFSKDSKNNLDEFLSLKNYKNYSDNFFLHYAEIDHVSYYDFFNHYEISRKCYAFSFRLHYEYQEFMKHFCTMTNIKLNVAKKINLNKFIINNCTTRCVCPDHEKWLKKENYVISKY